MTRAATIKRIAGDILGIETLEYRGRDSLDFHDVSVGSIKDALAAAYDAGAKAPEEGAVSMAPEKTCNRVVTRSHMLWVDRKKNAHGDEVWGISDTQGGFQPCGPKENAHAVLRAEIEEDPDDVLYSD